MKHCQCLLTIAAVSLAAGLASAESGPVFQTGPASSPNLGRVEKSANAPSNDASFVLLSGSRIPLVKFPEISRSDIETIAPLADESFLVRFGANDQLPARQIEIGPANFVFEAPIGRVQAPIATIREVVAALPGTERWRETFRELTRSRPDDWTWKGEASLDSQRSISPLASLKIQREGDGIERSLAGSLEAGTLMLAFYDDGLIDKTRRASVDLFFGGAAEPAVRINVGSDLTIYTATLSEKLATPTLAIARSTGWHQLRVDFSKDRLVAAIDGAAIVSNLHRGIEQPLSMIRLAASLAPLPLSATTEIPARHPPESSRRQSAATWFDDIVLLEAPSDATGLIRDPAQTELTDQAGDQWFGEVFAADNVGVVFGTSTGGRRRFGWSDIHKISFRDSAAPNWEWNGEIGRASFGNRGELTAALIAADRQNWTIEHPLLGKRTIPTHVIRSWTPLVIGRRRLLWTGPFHMGTKFVPEFGRSAPDGKAFRNSFALGNEVRDARLVLEIDGIERTDSQSPFAAHLREGRLASELWVNGKRISSLNDWFAGMPAQAKTVQVPLPAGVLKVGDNVIEIRQTPGPNADIDFDEIEIANLFLDQIAKNDKK